MQFACEFYKLISDRKTVYSPLNAANRGVTNVVMFAYVHKNLYILLSVLNMFFFFYDVNMNTQGFVYLEFVRYQLCLHRNVQAFASYNVCISALQ